jgi:GNAT superfamily N-acetyltransferase
MSGRVKIEHRGFAAERWEATLRDGRHVLIRPISPQDAQAEREFIARLSEQTRQRRFLGHVSSADEALIRQLTLVDGIKAAAYVATTPEAGKEAIVGACRYAPGAPPGHAECAVVVRDDWQGQGLGELMMRLLIEVARARGVSHLYSIDAVDNEDMAGLARGLGFERRSDPEDASEVIHELRL